MLPPWSPAQHPARPLDENPHFLRPRAKPLGTFRGHRDSFAPAREIADPVENHRWFDDERAALLDDEIEHFLGLGPASDEERPIIAGAPAVAAETGLRA